MMVAYDNTGEDEFMLVNEVVEIEELITKAVNYVTNDG